MTVRDRVANPSLSERVLVLRRVFDAPRELVFEAWTRPEHLEQWWGPQGFTTVWHEMEVRPGGTYRFCMRSPDGTDYVKRGNYREIVPPERLVFTFAWEDSGGAPGHELLVTLTFADHTGKTELTLRQEVFETVETCESHRRGWTSCFERFDEYLAATAAARL